MTDELVLVTGGTGFIARHCMLALLSAGYRVRTTVRSLAREGEVRAHLKTDGAASASHGALAPQTTEYGADPFRPGLPVHQHGLGQLPAAPQSGSLIAVCTDEQFAKLADVEIFAANYLYDLDYNIDDIGTVPDDELNEYTLVYIGTDPSTEAAPGCLTK